ncbi:hypothetical protein MAM1_0013d01324 [Mucor ambiguus]|uniref:Uncharacterized protein n=1 Tax=Mucor ambiguus TaxID=91626 RepID=A0A0C9M5R8_9FUNG|nr:hypothetical protein MAM1_0013d01324 [Mucor ambiguus]
MFDATTEDVSNHIVGFSVQVLRYITMLKTHTFGLETGNIQFVPTKAPFRLTDILLRTILDESTRRRLLPPPLNRVFVNSEKFEQPARNFLNEQHLEHIYTTYFGRKPGSNILARYPLHNTVFDTLPRPDNVPPVTFHHAKFVARNTFKTNFENLWNLNRRFINVFNNFITILLRLHLAPERETKYQDYLKSKRQDQDDDTPTTPEKATSGKTTFAGKLTNQTRRIFSYDSKKAQSERGQWGSKAKRSADRLTTFTIA